MKHKWQLWASTCIVSLLLTFAIFGALCGGSRGETSSNASIGGTNVPRDLHCQEDEVISFVGIDKLGCIHLDGNRLEWSIPTPMHCASSVSKPLNGPPSTPERTGDCGLR